MTERKLRKIDALFAGPGQAAPIPVSQRRLEVIPHDLIDAHPKHPFKPYNGEGRPGLLESVQTMGVLQPILLQAKPDGRYTLLAGYKRLYCNTQAGNREILALVDEDIPDAAAELIVTQTNATQYGLGDFLPSEMAYALKMELDALTELRRQLKEKGEAADKIEVGNRVYHMVHLERSRDNIAKAYGLKTIEVQRYIQLTKLLPALLDLVDQKYLPIRTGVVLSTLPEEIQFAVLGCLKEGRALTVNRAQAIKAEYQAGELTPERVRKFFYQPADIPKKATISLRPGVIKKYFTADQSKEEIQRTVEEALRLYFER